MLQYVEIRVQRGVEADWPRVRDLRLAALTDAPDAFWATLAEERRLDEAAWRERVRTPGVAQLIATCGGADAGLTVVAPHYDGPPDGAVYSVWVGPPWRGRGVGDALMRAALAAGRELGYPRLRIDVGVRNAAAHALYARAGFRETGHRYRFPPPREHVEELEMCLRL